MAGIAKVAKAAGIKQTQVHALFAAIMEAVGRGERVYIKDFGAFSIQVRAPRTVTSPQIPGGQADIPERKVIRFKASPNTRQFLNGEEG